VFLAMDGGWQGRLDEKGRGLSGGQRQRVVLARALAREPEVLIMVEPTSAVDAHTEAMIAERLAEYRRGRTTIVTTGSPLLLHHADRVAFLSGSGWRRTAPTRSCSAPPAATAEWWRERWTTDGRFDSVIAHNGRRGGMTGMTTLLRRGPEGSAETWRTPSRPRGCRRSCSRPTEGSARDRLRAWRQRHRLREQRARDYFAASRRPERALPVADRKDVRRFFGDLIRRRRGTR
jgi:ABC-type antimicrobial peptide transport system ATPase subunit